MSKVQTTKGLIDRELLEVREIVNEDDNSRAVATEWTLNGELVRRDVHVAILRGHELGAAVQEIA